MDGGGEGEARSPLDFVAHPPFYSTYAMLQESNRTEEFKEAVKARAQSFPPSKTRPRPLPANTDNWTIQAEQVVRTLVPLLSVVRVVLMRTVGYRLRTYARSRPSWPPLGAPTWISVPPPLTTRRNRGPSTQRRDWLHGRASSGSATRSGTRLISGSRSHYGGR